MNARKPQIIAKSSPTIKQNRNTRSPVKNEIKNFMEMYRVTSAIVFVIMNIIFLLRRSSGNAVFTFSFIPRISIKKKTMNSAITSMTFAVENI